MKRKYRSGQVPRRVPWRLPAACLFCLATGLSAPPAEQLPPAPEEAPLESPRKPDADPGGKSDAKLELPEEEIRLEELEPAPPSTGEPGIDQPLPPLTRSDNLLPAVRKFRSLMQTDLQPESRAGLAGLYTERRNRNRFSTTVTGTLFGEVLLTEYASIHLNAPYTRKDEPESAPRERIDNISAGMKFAPGAGPLRPAMGLEIFFASGDETVEIGSHNKGNLETYAGLLYAGEPVSFQGNIRYNTQSNLELNPPPGVKFDRTWFLELGLGFRLDRIEFVLELTRKGRVAPDERSQWSTVLTPGVNFGRRGGFVFSVGAPFTLSRGREYDYGLFLRGEYAW